MEKTWNTSCAHPYTNSCWWPHGDYNLLSVCPIWTQTATSSEDKQRLPGSEWWGKCRGESCSKCHMSRWLVFVDDRRSPVPGSPPGWQGFGAAGSGTFFLFQSRPTSEILLCFEHLHKKTALSWFPVSETFQPKLLSRELLDLVASHFTLKEKDYFGLCFIDDT